MTINMDFMSQSFLQPPPISTVDVQFPPASLFAADLTVSVTDADIELLFEQYGDLRCVELFKEEFLTYAYIHFENVVDANRAFEALHGEVFQEKRLNLMWLHPCPIIAPMPKNPQLLHQNSQQYRDQFRVPMIQMLFSFICAQGLQGINAEFFGALFSSFGLLVHVGIKHIKVNMDRGSQSGYGFVHFCSTWEGLFAATRCVRWFRKKNVDGVTVDAKFGEQFKRFLQRSGYFPEDDPIFTETAPPSSSYNTNPQMMGVMMGESSFVSSFRSSSTAPTSSLLPPRSSSFMNEQPQHLQQPQLQYQQQIAPPLRHPGYTSMGQGYNPAATGGRGAGGMMVPPRGVGDGSTSAYQHNQYPQQPQQQQQHHWM